MPTITFDTIQELLDYIDEYVIPNGNNEITGEIENNVSYNSAQFIIKYAVNAEKAAIVNSSGSVGLSKPITVFITNTPSELSWADNVQFEYYICNATANNIPLQSGLVYYDMYLAPTSVIPARSVVHIAKAENDLWVQVNNIGGAGGDLPPQAAHDGEFLFTNGTSPAWRSPCIFIKSSDFEDDGVTYINEDLDQNKFLLFWNDLSRLIYNEELTHYK